MTAIEMKTLCNMDCGGRAKRRHRFGFATRPPLTRACHTSHDESKAVSPLRSATAVHIAHTPPGPRLSRDEFQHALLAFINHPRVDADTPLFETGLIDSLAILNLMTLVEEATGRAVPPRMVVMKHFRTINAIVDTFWKEDS